MEIGSLPGGIIFGVGGDEPSLQVLNRHILDIEANIVAGVGLSERFVVHLYGLDLSGGSGGGEVDEHARLDLASLDTTHGNRSNATNLVNVLKKG